MAIITIITTIITIIFTALRPPHLTIIKTLIPTITITNTITITITNMYIDNLFRSVQSISNQETNCSLEDKQYHGKGNVKFFLIFVPDAHTYAAIEKP